ncbi:MAG: NADPH:quinone reductase [Gordonia sp.]|nr:NADPH:quinone reductase [Gordonia sp. (in: high G+C Gram-positive bacteria)]
MRAARFHQYGPADTLIIEDAPEPIVGPGQIRIRVAAASVNPVDWKIRSGAVQEAIPADLPAIPGQDAAGVVDQIGAGVPDVKIGDRVFGLTNFFGAAAEFAVLSYWAPVPSQWTLEQAAGAGLVVTTAATALNALGDLKDRTLLIEGAAGGVGSAAVAIAVGRGARVVGTASAPKHDFLRALGALPTTYGTGLAERVAALAPNGVDVALDVVGSGSLPDLVAIVGAENVVTLADYTTAPGLGVRLVIADNNSASLAEGAELGARGIYTPHISESFPLERTGDAHDHVQRGHTLGKVILTL